MPGAWFAWAWTRIRPRLPADLRADAAKPFLAFNRRIVDATADLAAAYKPQIAFYSARAREDELARQHPLHPRAAPHALRDPRRQARRHRQHRRGICARGLRSLRRRCGDRQPLYGRGFGASVPRAARTAARSCCAAPRTRCPGLPGPADRRPAAVPRVAERAASSWNPHRNLMLVVGATFPREMAELRAPAPELPFLVPGIGAQGGDLEGTLTAGLDAQGAGLLINSSRGIIYAGGGAPAAIRAAAVELREAINRRRPLAAAAHGTAAHGTPEHGR